MRRCLSAGGAILAAWLAGASGAAAQGTVHAATFVAELAEGDSEVRVQVVFEFTGVAPGDSVPVSLLDFGDAVARDVRVAGADAPATLVRGPGAARSGYLSVGAGPEGSGWLQVTYRVPVPEARGGAGVHLRLPVLTVDLPPEAARPGLFRGQVQVPRAWRVAEGFPTGLAATGADGALDVSLQVVPSLVSLRARTDGTWRPGLPLLLDGVAMAGLLLFSVLGWRHLTRSPS